MENSLVNGRTVKSCFRSQAASAYISIIRREANHIHAKFVRSTATKEEISEDTAEPTVGKKCYMEQRLPEVEARWIGE
jgi:hypothetical protein